MRGASWELFWLLNSKQVPAVGGETMSDNISRQSALDALKAIWHGLWEIDIPSPAGCPEYVEHHEQIQHMMGVVDGWIKKISEEEPTDRNGHWIQKNYYDTDWNVYECDQCGEPWQLEAGTPKDNKMNYCPHCGADMRGV